MSSISAVYKEELAKDIWEIDRGDLIALKNKAQLFLQRAREVSDVYENIAKKTKLKDQLDSVYTVMKKDTQFTRDLMQLAHSFEISINSFLGRTIYLTYVTKEGELLYYGDANIGKLYETLTRNKGRGNLTRKKMFDANDLDEELKIKLQKSQQQRQAVYRTAVTRWEETKRKNKNKYRAYYWKLANNRRKYTDNIATRGIIAEGYANAVINEDASVVNNQESSLKVLWNRYIQADSVGGLVKGDVVLNSNGQIQFAVKSGSFSTARFGQYLNFAENIQQISQLTVDEIQKESVMSQLIKNQKSLDENIIKAGLKEIEDTIENKIIKELK